jgi:hypothetical protein
VLAAVLGAGGCGGVGAVLPYDEPYLEAARKPYELRYRRDVGLADRYQAIYQVRVRNDVEVDEDITAELMVYTTGKTTGPEAFDRVILRRREEERKWLEVAPNGRVTQQETVRDIQPTVTPNFEAEPGTKLVFIPYDALGRIAKRKETPYHFAWYDSLCYVFPVFPKEPVAPGDKWTYETPLIVGRGEHTRIPFALRAEFLFKDLRKLRLAGGREGPVCAVVEYTYHGILDTAHAQDAGKIPANAKGVLRIRDVVEGEGLAYLDIEKGKVRWRRESYRILCRRETERPPKREKEKPSGEPKLERVEYSSDNSVTFTCRLLETGERASERPARSDR